MTGRPDPPDTAGPARTVSVGLTGGIGAGKSAAARAFADLGALVLDADAIAREVVEPGTPGLARVVAAFGADVLRPDGTLDRPLLGRLVFGDEDARLRLNAIVHPLVGTERARRLAAVPAGSVVVSDVPLLVETGTAGDHDLVVVVEAPVELRLERLLARGLDAQQARARIAAQADDEQRRAVADVLLSGAGDLDALRAQVRRAWDERVVPMRGVPG